MFASYGFDFQFTRGEGPLRLPQELVLRSERLNFSEQEVQEFASMAFRTFKMLQANSAANWQGRPVDTLDFT